MTGHADGFRDLELLPGQTLADTAEWDGVDCDPSGKYCILVRGDFVVAVSWSFESPGPEVTASFKVD